MIYDRQAFEADYEKELEGLRLHYCRATQALNVSRRARLLREVNPRFKHLPAVVFGSAFGWLAEHLVPGSFGVEGSQWVWDNRKLDHEPWVKEWIAAQGKQPGKYAALYSTPPCRVPLLHLNLLDAELEECVLDMAGQVRPKLGVLEHVIDRLDLEAAAELMRACAKCVGTLYVMVTPRGGHDLEALGQVAPSSTVLINPGSGELV